MDFEVGERANELFRREVDPLGAGVVEHESET